MTCFFSFKKRRREKLRKRDFPLAWTEAIERFVPYFTLLSAADRQELQEHIQIFINEKRFSGCGDLIVTDEMKVVIAAQACILLLRRNTDYFPKLKSILIYPDAFVSKVQQHHPGGIVSEGLPVRVGESWGYGTVVLAWDAVVQGASDINDASNVVLHEFAHQLDEESGSANGAPVLKVRSQYTAWARILGADFVKLGIAADRNKKTVIDKYGATNPAEFFAVATETFFEKAVQLKRKHPELYEELKNYYRQDPASFRKS